MSWGIDITKQGIPVVPCHHYMMGGIKVDYNGQSSINRLYAAGECSCTGLHGGNRLASNSLIEAVVYADLASKHALGRISELTYNDEIPDWINYGYINQQELFLIEYSKREVQQIMQTYVGIVRSNLRLKRAWTRLDCIYEETEKIFLRSRVNKDICELRNMINTGYLIMRQAMERHESRGGHFSIDYQHAEKEVEGF